MFADAFTSETEPLQETAIVLTNRTDKKIVAVTVTWIFDEGHERRLTSHSDSFMTQKASPVAMPRSRLLAMPSLFLPESLHFPSYIGAARNRNVRLLETASQITVELDSVVLEDGEVIGPNRSRYDTEIQDRKTAAEMVTKQVRAAITAGQEPSLLLAHLAASRPSRTDYVGKWAVRFAMHLEKSKDFEAELRNLESLPKPPAFFTRKNK
jgi:hypothetical protein